MAAGQRPRALVPLGENAVSTNTVFGVGHDPIHYGPVWSKPRKDGESFAACDTADGIACLTTHLPWVTCPDCKARLPETQHST